MYTLILGFDSFDPTTFESLSSEGKLPNLRRFVEEGKYSRFLVSDPPQTEVSWTSIATGLNPGGHGIFDFVHRDPASYTPFISLLPTKRSAGSVQFAPPFKARTIFEEATRQGYPATALWWPGMFPARLELPMRTLPGLGTPDLLGKLGVGTLFTNDSSSPNPGHKTRIKTLYKKENGRFSASLEGPNTKKNNQPVSTDFQLEVVDDQNGRLVIANQSISLTLGKWSPIFEVSFKVSRFFSLKAITRAILTQVKPEVRLYILPLQIHPLASPWRYATPPAFIKQLWKNWGPFLTLGWPQDTTALEEGHINDQQFLDLCESIFTSRERVLMNNLVSFQEGILAIVFDCLDRIQHMFKHNRPDIIEDWYIKLDRLVGRVQETLHSTGRKKLKLLVISDHGFSSFNYKVHLNQWLVNNQFLTLHNDNHANSLESVDWSLSQAYAIGLNSLYVNLESREGKGCVALEQYETLVDKIAQKLLTWQGPDARPIIQRVLKRKEAFSGPLASYGPDLVVGYAPGYRASAETGLGKWKEQEIEMNHDQWGADHCIDSQAVPGVFFSSHGLEGLSQPSFYDIPMLSLGKEIEHSKSGSPPPPTTISGEKKEILEERLKSLGYL